MAIIATSREREVGIQNSAYSPFRSPSIKKAIRLKDDGDGDKNRFDYNKITLIDSSFFLPNHYPLSIKPEQQEKMIFVAVTPN